ncbi:minor capsid protein [Xanthomonas phage JGB6]|nr:minor capsid protein [Xanthomonas phage JGB6]
MSDKLYAVAEILTNEGIAIPGDTLYIANMPEGYQNGVVLIDDPDSPTEIDEYIPKLKKSDFRAVIRGSNYENAMALAKQVRVTLDKYNYTATNGLKFLRLKPTYDPIAYPVSDSDVIEVSVNLWTAYIDP